MRQPELSLWDVNICRRYQTLQGLIELQWEIELLLMIALVSIFSIANLDSVADWCYKD